MPSTVPTFDYSQDPNSAHVECAICLMAWSGPKEIKPCGHIFCGDCLGELEECPECREKIVDKVAPNRVLLNMVMSLTGKCSMCGWTGTKEQFDTHHVDNCPGPPPQPASPKLPEPDLAELFGVPPPNPNPPPPPAQPTPSSSASSPADPFAAVLQPAGSAQSPAVQQQTSGRQDTEEFERDMQRAMQASMQENYAGSNNNEAPSIQQQQPPQQTTERNPYSPPSSQQFTPQLPSDVERIPSVPHYPPPSPQASVPQQQLQHPAEFPLGEGDNGGLGGRVPSTMFSDTPPWTEYGMKEETYNDMCSVFLSLCEKFGDKLSFYETRRFLNVFDLPSNDTVISEIFTMFGEDTAANGQGGVTFHQLCVWIPGHRRDPMKEYDLSSEAYDHLLQEYRLLDTTRKGYFTDDEAQMFLAILRQNGVAQSTWADIKHLLDGKKANDPQYPPGVLLHDLLIVCASNNEGWDVCEADASPVVPPPPPQQQPSASQQQRSVGTQPRRPHAQTLQPSRTIYHPPPPPPPPQAPGMPPPPQRYMQQQTQYPTSYGYSQPPPQQQAYPPYQQQQQSAGAYPPQFGQPPQQQQYVQPHSMQQRYPPMPGGRQAVVPPQQQPVPAQHYPRVGPNPNVGTSTTTRRNRSSTCKHQ